jgi:two-component system sensor histidine kinase MprB
LTAIKLRIEELRATLDPSPGTTTAEYLDEMLQEVDRLTMLASGLLMMAAAEQGGVVFESLPAVPAVEQAVGRVRPLARHGGVDVTFRADADGVAVRAPRGAFEEVVFNVLDNAVKYSPSGAVVDVDVATEDESLLVRVGDRGPGLTPEDAEHAFEPFFRSRRTGRVRGSGLGLAICARLCEASGATIALEPRDGGGTLAVVRWPAV